MTVWAVGLTITATCFSLASGAVWAFPLVGISATLITCLPFVRRPHAARRLSIAGCVFAYLTFVAQFTVSMVYLALNENLYCGSASTSNYYYGRNYSDQYTNCLAALYSIGVAASALWLSAAIVTTVLVCKISSRVWGDRLSGAPREDANVSALPEAIASPLPEAAAQPDPSTIAV